MGSVNGKQKRKKNKNEGKRALVNTNKMDEMSGIEFPILQMDTQNAACLTSYIRGTLEAEVGRDHEETERRCSCSIDDQGSCQGMSKYDVDMCVETDPSSPDTTKVQQNIAKVNFTVSPENEDLAEDMDDISTPLTVLRARKSIRFNDFMTTGHGKRHVCRSSKSKTGITVRYTRVYGEADGAYRNDSTPRGLVFMCNISEFDNHVYLYRRGSEVDYHNLRDLFQQMGYGVGRRNDNYFLNGHVTREVFMERLKDFCKDPRHMMLGSCVVVVMSHGNGPKTFVTSDNQVVDLMEVYTEFNNINCPQLKGKPKIFILQFCRNLTSPTHPQQDFLRHDEDIIRKLVREELRKILGGQQDIVSEKLQNPTEEITKDINVLPGTSTSPHQCLVKNQRTSSLKTPMTSSADKPLGKQFHTSHSCPGLYDHDTRRLTRDVSTPGLQKYSDMYSVFSTPYGEMSYRDPVKGSLLIQAICHVFAENAYQDDLQTLVAKVSIYMTTELQKDDPITVPRVTCERTNNGLDKKFYFNPDKVHVCRNVTI